MGIMLLIIVLLYFMWSIAVLVFDAEELVHGLRQVLELHIAIIHASHDADAIYHFYKVNGIASPFH